MTSAEQAPANAAFDASFLDAYTGGDKEIRNQVLELFLTQTDLLLTRLKEAKGNAQAWHEAAHSLKGCASGVGANGLAGLARQAELGSTASADVQDKMIRELAVMVAATCEKVRDVLANY